MLFFAPSALPHRRDHAGMSLLCAAAFPLMRAARGGESMDDPDRLDRSPDPQPKRQANVVLEMLAWVVAAVLLTVAAYAHRAILGWLVRQLNPTFAPEPASAGFCCADGRSARCLQQPARMIPRRRWRASARRARGRAAAVLGVLAVLPVAPVMRSVHWSLSYPGRRSRRSGE